MKTDFAFKNDIDLDFNPPPPKKRRLRRVLIFFVLFGLIGGVTGSIYHYKKASISTWLSKGKDDLQQGIADVKQLAQAKPESEVHFEFYSSLPHNRLPSQPLFASNDVEKELVAEKLAGKYFIQLDSAKTALAASKLPAELAKNGISASVTKVKIGNKVIYRLQSGFYSNKDQATLAVRQLERKGVIGVVHKL